MGAVNGVEWGMWNFELTLFAKIQGWDSWWPVVSDNTWSWASQGPWIFSVLSNWDLFRRPLIRGLLFSKIFKICQNPRVHPKGVFWEDIKLRPVLVDWLSLQKYKVEALDDLLSLQYHIIGLSRTLKFQCFQQLRPFSALQVPFSSSGEQFQK